MPRFASRLAAASLALAMSLAASAYAEARPIVVAALKGPSGIGLVRLFDDPPSMPDSSELKVIASPSADLMAAKLVSGEYDVGVLPINVAAKLYSAGIPIRIGAVIGEGMVSFLTRDPAIKGLADLKGRKINVAGQAATPDYLFRRLLKGAGIDPAADLELDYALSYPEAAAALAAGKISCAVLPEPFATMALLADPTLRSPLDLGKLWTASTGQSSYPMTALVLSSKLAAERPQDAAAIMKACSSSISWVLANPAAAGGLVEKADLGLKAAIAAKAIPKSAYAYVPAKAARPSIEALLSVFMELAPASVGGRLPDDGFYAY